LKLDPNGNVLWNRFYKFNNDAAASTMIVYCDGSILAAGFRVVDIDFTHELEPFILKTDPEGNTLWCKYYANTYWGATIENLVPDKQGHYILNYVVNNAGGLIASAFVTLDEDGDVTDVKAYPHLMIDFIPTIDNGFVAAGREGAGNSLGGFTLMKFDQNLHIPCADSTFDIQVRDTIPFDTAMGRSFTGAVVTDFTIQKIDTFFADTVLCFETTNPGEIILQGCYNKKDSLFVPNIFTPNHDGLNETFKIFFNSDVTSFQLNVYNRWGNEVFTSMDLNTSWDGKSKQGSDCAEGTFYYILKLNGYKKRGYVILKR
jgi:gliding motility-associated-like protein